MTTPVNGLGPIAPVMPVAGVTPTAPGREATAAAAGPSFAETLQQALAATNALQLEAGHQAELLAAGLVDDAHTVTIAAERASLALQLTVAVRNKVVEAYQEIMRMQV